MQENYKNDIVSIENDFIVIAKSNSQQCNYLYCSDLPDLN